VAFSHYQIKKLTRNDYLLQRMQMFFYQWCSQKKISGSFGLWGVSFDFWAYFYAFLDLMTRTDSFGGLYP